MKEVLDQYAKLLWEMLQYDISVFSQGWMYYWFLVPVTFYFAFFMIKWYVLLIPITLPLTILKNAFVLRREKIKKGA